MLAITPLVPGRIWCCNLKENEMQEMTMDEVDQVEGGYLSIDRALDIIGGITAACSVIPGLQGAAAFGAGVYLGGNIVLAWL